MAHVPRDLLDRLAKLEREVRTLRGRANIRPALDSVLGGNVVIGRGGQLIAQTPYDVRTFVVGQTADGDWGIGLGREDGSRALTVGDEAGTDAQMIRMFSRDAQVIVMDDAFSDRFLGRPWMPVPLYPTSAQVTSSTGYLIGWRGAGPVHNAVAYLRLITYAGTGGGQVRVVMTPPDGTERVLAEYDAAPGTSTVRSITYPLDGLDYLDYASWRIDHRTKGAGSVETDVIAAYTRNTFSADEAPTTPAQ
ncbi:hypothetical protein [Streptomyces iconiensis]|uniref:Uncharacterized protein n=1 Tax=Streptomyces iconiensis TaxID=1384038 RepID=A0ABT7A4D2_9ACTN|nr:hypothetical protein [Streptomyces iconiensis]MDJ1136208.1 hypothetical protein [Streptomyces iconiensis]